MFELLTIIPAVQKFLIWGWVDALESGKFSQTNGCLRATYNMDYGVEARYCCLGVFCETVAPVVGGKWNQYSDFVTPSVINVWGDFSPMTGNLNLDFAALFGMEQHHLDILIAMNDRAKCDFNQIAQVVRTMFVSDRLGLDVGHARVVGDIQLSA